MTTPLATVKTPLAPTRAHLITAVAIGVGLFALVLLVASSGHLDILKSAVESGKESREGLGKLITASNKLMGPSLVAAGAIYPLALVAGGGALLMGNKKGGQIIAIATGGLILIASAAGIAQ